MTRERNWRRRWWPAQGKWVMGVILILLLLTPGGASLVAARPAASSGSSWLRIRMNLSGSPGVVSGYPDIAISDDGNQVVVVWSEGYSGSAGAKHHGRVYLRWISENTGLWSPKITIDHGGNSSTDWAKDAAVALHGTTAHVVWVRVQNNSTYSVWHRSCEFDLNNPRNGECKTISSPFQLEYDPSNEISFPDVAVDNNGNVFVVWVRSGYGIRYREYAASSSSWSAAETISKGSEAKSWPAIGVGGSTAYAVWIRKYQDTPSPLQYDVRKRHKTVGGAWESSDDIQTIYDAGVNNPSRHPNVVVGGSPLTAYAVWDREDDAENGFRVVYKYFNVYNIYWQPQGPTAWAGVPDKTTGAVYDATTSESVDSYIHYLRPAFALDSDGRLHAVWHHEYTQGEEQPIYRVLYSYSDNPTAASPTWNTPQVFAELSGNEDLSPEQRHFPVDNVAARIAVGPPRGGETKKHIHVVLMLQTGSGKWDVWYLSNEFYKTVSLPAVMKNY